MEFELLQQIEVEEEEELRRKMAEKLFLEMPTPTAVTIAKEQKLARENEVERRLSIYKDARNKQKLEQKDSERRTRDMYLAESKSLDPSIVTTNVENEHEYSQRSTTVLLNMNLHTATIVEDNEEEENLMFQKRLKRMYSTEKSSLINGTEVSDEEEVLRKKFIREIEREEMIANSMDPNGRYGHILTRNYVYFNHTSQNSLFLPKFQSTDLMLIVVLLNRVRSQSELNAFVIESSEARIERIYENARSSAGTKKRYSTILRVMQSALFVVISS